jgi:hypothetical protein
MVKAKFLSASLGAVCGATLLWAPAATLAQGKIEVGPNVQVSKARDKFAHDEIILAADPKDPNYLVGCSIVNSTAENKNYTAVYTSDDSGKTWRLTLETNNFDFTGDPACAFGANGAAYYVALARNENPKKKDDKDAKKEPENFMPVYHSTDHGMTWSAPTVIPFGFEGLDREYVVVDTTGGKYSGRVYVHGTGDAQAIDEHGFRTTLSLFRSSDGGVTFDPPVKREAPDGKYVLGMGNNVVLSDGTWVGIFGELRDTEWTGEFRHPDPTKPNAWLKILTSDDGGASLAESSTVADFFMDWPPDNSSVVPYIAVDATSGPFKDRLYAVWSDRSSGRDEIHFSYSSDKGKKWSPVRIINEDRPFPGGFDKPDHLMPLVAVNRDGVVGISWCDRRDNPDNLGWWERFSASLDGGETFLPSERVSEAANSYGKNDRFGYTAGAYGGGTSPQAPSGDYTISVGLDAFHFNGGHTGGMAATADGVFHPFWIDNRTGIHQIWTAPVHVQGSVNVHGSPAFAKLDDLSEKLALKITATRYEPEKGAVYLTAHLENTSKETLIAPMKLRITDVGSQLAAVEITNAENNVRGQGAVWTFNPADSSGKLSPDAKSEVKELAFHVSDIRLLHQPTREPKLGLISLKAQVLGKAEPKPEEKSSQ